MLILLFLHLFFLAAPTRMVSAAPPPEKMLAFLKQYNIDWSYPRVIEIAKQINYSALAPDVVGRVDITSTFVGAELNTEYLFGMFSKFGQNERTSLIGVPLSQTATQVVLQGNTLYTSLLVNFNWTVATIPVQFNTVFQFNDEGLVTAYDSVLVRSNWIFPLVIPQLAARIAAELNEPADDPLYLVQKRAALDICGAHETSCLGAYKQYESTEECMSFIMNLPFGDIWQAGQNTGICRYLHTAMVPDRPGVHCPHIGPTGGEMCNTKTYEQLVLENPFPQPLIQLPDGHSWPP